MRLKYTGKQAKFAVRGCTWKPGETHELPADFPARKLPWMLRHGFEIDPDEPRGQKPPPPPPQKVDPEIDEAPTMPGGDPGRIVVPKMTFRRGSRG